MMIPDSRRTFGEVPEDFKRLVVNAASKKEEPPVKAKHYLTLIIAAVLLVAIACTAVAAILLQYSPQFNAVKEARNVLWERYEMTPVLLSLFQEKVTETEEGWFVRYTPSEFAQQMGVYEVSLNAKKKADARWSYDGADLEALKQAGMESEIWGPAQLMEFMSIITAYQEKREAMIAHLGNPFEWSLADKAALDETLLCDGVFLAETPMNLIPTENDIQPEEAVTRMKEAITQKYGVQMETLHTYVDNLSFRQFPDTETPCYTLWVYDRAPDNETLISNLYIVEMASPSGEILRCQWRVATKDATLPEGPLDAYAEAVAEYMQSGALTLITDTAKRNDIQKRIREAGFGDLLDNSQLDTLPISQMTQPEVTDVALKALQENYGLTDDMLSLFTASVSSTADGRWEVHMLPSFPRIQDQLAEPLGEYTVIIDTQTSEVLEVAWSYDGVLKRQYSEHELGIAPAWNAQMIPWFQTFNEKRIAMEEAFEERDKVRVRDGVESRLDTAAYHTLFREAGFDKEIYREGIPGAKDIPFEQAFALVKLALQEEYGITEALFDQYGVYPAFVVTDPDHPVWEFSVFSKMGGESYWVVLDGQTGEIITNVYHFIGHG